jgi:hypothetical protein
MVINNEYFREVAVKGIPKMIPNSREYFEWWREQIKRCREGYSIGGKYCPGRLYWHLNFFPIERNINNSKRKQQGLADPRDIEWEIFPIIDKCKGFTGLDRNGKPLFDGPVKGFLMVGPRDYGKSVIAASNIAYEYTFFKDNEILISAYDTKYISPTMAKVKYALDRLPGSVEFMGEIFPSPLSHKRLRNKWDEEVRSGFINSDTGLAEGYNSRILVRTYMDNHTAANGTRPSFHVFEEIGMFNNLLPSYEASTPCWMDSGQQFGMPFLIGTGGDMEKGSVDVRRMFYQPEAHNLMTFEDEWDNTGGKICYFLPAWKGLNRFKDADGNTKKEDAILHVQKERESKKKDKVAYEQHMQYYPMTPKEAFLVTTGNIFPRALIEDQLSFLLSSKKAEHLGQKGRLSSSPDGTLKWIPDDSLFEVDFPHDARSTGLYGCITIYEHPQFSENETIPPFLYIGACDPYDHDTSTTDSLGSLFIYKRFWTADRTYEIPVAEYTGRPEKADEFYENVRKLLTYYNAKCLYENNVKGLKQYFDHKRCLYLLEEQPNYLKDIVPNSKVQRGYGIHMDKYIKNFALGRVREWLITESGGEGRYNVHKIYSINLLKELLYYNDNGNFDRVMAFAILMIYNEASHKIDVQRNIDLEQDLTFDNWFQKMGIPSNNPRTNPSTNPSFKDPGFLPGKTMENNWF